MNTSAENYSDSTMTARMGFLVLGRDSTGLLGLALGQLLVGDAFVGCGDDQGVKPNPSAAFHSLMQFLLVNELFYCSL